MKFHFRPFLVYNTLMDIKELKDRVQKNKEYL